MCLRAYRRVKYHIEVNFGGTVAESQSRYETKRFIQIKSEIKGKNNGKTLFFSKNVSKNLV